MNHKSVLLCSPLPLYQRAIRMKWGVVVLNTFGAML